MKKSEDKVALITGAAVGLGEGIARVYVKYGANLLLVDISEQVKMTAETIKL
ncbi:SDR family NAD(P)-dependent oxidoreductase [Clostridiales bacterium COT073_COT-073]|nr:SDR family NAD(P)-dependent oxidoreductase [Clostridiales bacterium COT073_COT-073]